MTLNDNTEEEIDTFLEILKWQLDVGGRCSWELFSNEGMNFFNSSLSSSTRNFYSSGNSKAGEVATLLTKYWCSLMPLYWVTKTRGTFSIPPSSHVPRQDIILGVRSMGDGIGRGSGTLLRTLVVAWSSVAQQLLTWKLFAWLSAALASSSSPSP